MPRLLGVAAVLCVVFYGAVGQESPLPGLPGTCPAFALPPSTWIACDLSAKTEYYAQQPSSSYTAAPAGCSAVHAEYLARHGSRMPSNSDIPKLSQLSAVLQANGAYISNAQYDWMKTWVDPYTAATAGLLLIPDGANEHFYTAKRMMANYPQVFAATNYSPTTMVLQSSQVSRAGQSGSAFAFGLLQNKGAVGGASRFAPYYIWSESPADDLQIRFFDNCPAFQRQLASPATNRQADLFAAKYLPAMGLAIAVHIGSFPHFVPNASTVTEMFTACQYDVAIANDTTHFCSLFNETEYQLMNYLLDLGYYYQRGYGYDVNWQQATLLLQDMYNNTACVVNSQGSAACPATKMRFGHAETIMPAVAILGLFRDPEPLMANWSPQQMRHRQWRTSVITPFAANVNMVLYSCPSNVTAAAAYKVKLLVNERETVLPGCSDLYCDWDEFTAVLKPKLTLNFDQVCQRSTCDATNSQVRIV